MPTEKELLEREIAKLTGVIAGKNRNLTHGHPKSNARVAAHPYTKPGNKTFRPGQASSSSTINNAAGPSSASGSGSSTSHSMTIASNVPGTSDTAGGKGKPAEESWVNNTSRHGNKSLINPEVYLQQQKARLAHTSKPPPLALDRPRRPKKHPNYDTQTRGDGKRVVVIDGIVYEFEGGGKKLKRVDDDSSVDPNVEPDIVTPTRSSFSISGQQYVRTRAGNLVRRKSSSQTLNKKLDVKKKGQPCRYFTKTGACQRASTCPYVHDPTKISVCSKYLRGTCPHADTACPVSHKPDPHNAPSCVHFQRTGQCKNGKECRYPHVKVKDDAPVCLDFSTIGWCARGAACGERHAWECREYSETGACKKGKKCELMHILRAKPSAPKEEEGPSEGGGADDGMALPHDLVEVLRGERQAGVRPSEDDDDDDDSEEETGSDDEEVDTADEEDDVDVIAGQQDFIQFNRPDEVDMD